MTSRELKVCLARLGSLSYHVGGVGGVSAEVIEDFNSIMDSLAEFDSEFLRLKLSMNSREQLGAALSQLTGNREVFPRDLFSARAGQAHAILKARAPLQLSIEGAKARTLPFVEDEELRSRAVSLLDREEGYQGKKTGPNLVSEAPNNDPSLAMLRVSDDPAEQQGFANLCRGVMEFLRNSSHHTFKVISREDASKVCVMVDYLLGVLSAAKLKDQP